MIFEHEGMSGQYGLATLSPWTLRRKPLGSPCLAQGCQVPRKCGVLRTDLEAVPQAARRMPLCSLHRAALTLST